MLKKRNVHFIGIGGIGMSAIAEILYSKGFTISGSDITDNIIIRRLKKKGIKVFSKHAKQNIRNIDIVVYSSAVKFSNIEIKSAIKKKIPLYSRAMMLADVMRLKSSITVSGSHGKTTSTSLISCILERANFDPTIINGGIINGIGANAKLGNGEWIVAEADESDGSFTMLPSTIGVINNIDLEHLDYYKNLDDIKASFIKYANNIPFYGFLSINIDDKNISNIFEKINHKQIYTYGFSKKANFRAANVQIIKKNNTFFSCFDIINNIEKKILKKVLIPLIGSHNISNTLAAYSVSKGLKITDSLIKDALKRFKGVKRRFSIIYKSSDTLIIDDYAHHPKEIKMTLNALKKITKNKLIAIFEPHRFSRIKELKDEFLNSFENADIIFVLPIYTAGEKPIKKINNFELSKLLKKKYKEKIVSSIDGTKSNFNEIKKIISRKDNIIFLGAGFSSSIAEEFKNFLEKNE